MLKKTLGEMATGSMNWVEVEDKNGNMMKYARKDYVEEQIMTNNKKQFRLTESPPPMVPPLINHLGFLGGGGGGGGY